MEEMDRLKAEESRMREAKKFDEWNAKEEEFHRRQARASAAIRLVEGRERPVDVLAKNLLLFGLDKEREEERIAKYKERYNVMEDLRSERTRSCLSQPGVQTGRGRLRRERARPRTITARHGLTSCHSPVGKSRAGLSPSIRRWFSRTRSTLCRTATLGRIGIGRASQGTLTASAPDATGTSTIRYVCC